MTDLPSARIVMLERALNEVCDQLYAHRVGSSKRVNAINAAYDAAINALNPPPA